MSIREKSTPVSKNYANFSAPFRRLFQRQIGIRGGRAKRGSSTRNRWAGWLRGWRRNRLRRLNDIFGSGDLRASWIEGRANATTLEVVARPAATDIAVSIVVRMAADRAANRVSQETADDHQLQESRHRQIPSSRENSGHRRKAGGAWKKDRITGRCCFRKTLTIAPDFRIAANIRASGDCHSFLHRQFEVASSHLLAERRVSIEQ